MFGENFKIKVFSGSYIFIIMVKMVNINSLIKILQSKLSDVLGVV